MPRFVIVSFAREQAEIVADGVTSAETFQRLFLDPYDFAGERYHPGKGAVIRGALIVVDESILVTVPIFTWRAAGGATTFLCQATDDGRPPAFSAISSSERDLFEQIERMLASRAPC